MVSAGFNEENGVLNTPAGMTAEECEPLSVWQGRFDNGFPVVISCWKMTAEELEEIKRTGRVWLIVMGHTMPPVQLVGTSPWKEGERT